MKLSFIGMSGAGKSYWSQKLQQEGFVRICCDDLIEARLDAELKAHNFRGIADVAKWMGQPYDEQYPETSRRYLELEAEVMQEALVAMKNYEGNCVLDTTGSAIYMPDQILKELKNNTTVVYLETPPEVQAEMFRQYIADPKPVIWGDSFNMRAGEDKIDALARCYPDLLAYRSSRYEQIAARTLGREMLHGTGFDVASFIREVSPPLGLDPRGRR